jgi:hypothetical protein
VRGSRALADDAASWTDIHNKLQAQPTAKLAPIDAVHQEDVDRNNAKMST